MRERFTKNSDSCQNKILSQYVDNIKAPEVTGLFVIATLNEFVSQTHSPFPQLTIQIKNYLQD